MERKQRWPPAFSAHGAPGFSGVARIWCSTRRGTKLIEKNLRMAQKYYEIHAKQ